MWREPEANNTDIKQIEQYQKWGQIRKITINSNINAQQHNVGNIKK